ncbi:MAG: N-6 DNA methylase [Nitrospira sp.]
MTDAYVNNIIHSLEKVGSGAYRRFEIFNDWLELVETSLTAIPAHLESVSQHKTFAEDNPEAKQLWARMRNRYQNSPASWKHLADAFGYLLESTQNDFDDVLGRVYMAWEIGNARAGQYFTPVPVAKVMTKMTLGNFNDILKKQLAKATENNPLAQALGLCSLLDADEVQMSRLMQRFLMNILPVEPLRIQDPACGSGVMLLSAAAEFPRWAIDYGFVRFYGMGIDLTCARMATINMMLYGINGYSIKCALAMSNSEIQSLPTPYSGHYLKAKVAHEAGDEATVEQIAAEVRQLTLLPDFSEATQTPSKKSRQRHKPGQKAAQSQTLLSF